MQTHKKRTQRTVYYIRNEEIVLIKLEKQVARDKMRLRMLETTIGCIKANKILYKENVNFM